MFKLTEDCSNCGQPMLFGFPHLCRPVGEQRIREIIREEIMTAAAISPAGFANEAGLIRQLLENDEEEPAAPRQRRVSAKQGGNSRTPKRGKGGRPRKQAS